MTLTKANDGPDTALARVLFEDGSVSLPALRACLEEVRRIRATDPQASLALRLVEQGIATLSVVEAAQRRLIPVEDLGEAPDAIGPYRVVRELARGGMGAVYEAVHSGLGARYAVKTLLPGLLGEAGSEELDRFRREAEVMAQLDHPNVGRIHAADLEAQPPYLVQDLLSGGTLHRRVLAGGVSADEAVALVVKLAEGLGHCHERGVFHRDLKPQNVLFNERGEPVLVDFGLAKSLEASRRISRTGAVLGTPGYMAPEQATGTAPADARTDVYGLGGILYFLLSGRHPFAGGNLFEVLAQVLEDAPAPLPPTAPAWLAAVCLKALEKDPKDRYPDMAAFAGALREATAPSARPTRVSKTFLASGALLAVVLSLVAFALSIQALPDAQSKRTLRATVGAIPSAVHGQRVTVGFSVEPASAQARIRVGGGEWRGLAHAASYREEVELSLGPNSVTVEVRTQDGLRDEVTLQVESLTPQWWTEQDPASRAPYPLPQGLAYTGEAGVLVHERTRIELVHVPAGTFTLGQNASMEGVIIGGEITMPPHRTQISRGFFLGRYELTRDEYRPFADERGEALPTGDGRLPVVLSWNQAQAFCAWAGDLRLPTEAEWEYAAEGGDEGRLFPWGSEEPGPPHCNLGGAADGYEGPSPVGSYPEGESRWGNHDMSGNLWEWTEDALRYYPADPALELADPVVRGTGSRAIRGGGFRSVQIREASCDFRSYVGREHGGDHGQDRQRCGVRVVFQPPR